MTLPLEKSSVLFIDVIVQQSSANSSTPSMPRSLRTWTSISFSIIFRRTKRHLFNVGWLNARAITCVSRQPVLPGITWSKLLNFVKELLAQDTRVNHANFVRISHNAARSTHGSHNNGCQCPIDEDKHLRELEVADASEVPVVPPKVAEVMLPPAPAPEPYVPPAAAAPEATPPPAAAAPETPIATTGVMEKKHKRLPRTASQLPLTGLMGLLALTGGLALHFRRRESV